MRKIIEVPFLGVNDTECRIISWEAGDGAVAKGTLLCVLETTKTTFDIEAELDGYYYLITAIGETTGVGRPLCLFSTERETGDIRAISGQLIKEAAATEVASPAARYTRKAQILLEKHGLSPDVLLQKVGSDAKITENDVLDYLQADQESSRRKGIMELERVGVIGGASGGGALILIDSLLTTMNKMPVCVFDRDESFHGRKILGVPIVGSIDLLAGYLHEGRIDAVVIAFNRNLVERKRVFEELRSKGVPFTNIIDPAARIRSGVRIGTGNVILAGAYVGACSEIGDNNFISANVYLEHGNILGDGNAFGPGVFTSGNVTIGNGIRFGTGIFIEPNVTIGDHAIIASGAILTENVGDNTVVRVTRSQQFKPLQ
ncbi:MAG TPA: hypothetical protein VNW04_04850 [Puia sp.]|jgi:sugar O-acyltransferase (sialic acid O-acetyltransferase NeuD family)|nr:hypothetical protein [Puia sp.]